jgi:hypothetical protein
MKFALSLPAVALPIFLSAASTGFASAYYTISPGQEAIISFHFDGPPIQEQRLPNLLEFLIGGGTPLSVTSTTYSLYDGNTFLGGETRTGMSNIAGEGFRSFDNAITNYLFGPDVAVDFSSIRAGTIQGRLIYAPSFTNPSPGDYENIEFELYLINQTSTSGGWVEPNPIIDSIQIVPEPGTSALAVIGVLGLIMLRKPAEIRHDAAEPSPRKSLSIGTEARVTGMRT